MTVQYLQELMLRSSGEIVALIRNEAPWRNDLADKISQQSKEFAQHLPKLGRGEEPEQFLAAIESDRSLNFFLYTSTVEYEGVPPGLFLMHKDPDPYLEIPEQVNVALNWEKIEEREVALSVFKAWMLDRAPMQKMYRLFPFFLLKI